MDLVAGVAGFALGSASVGAVVVEAVDGEVLAFCLL